MCVAVLVLEAQEALGANTPFSLEPILVDLEGGALHGPDASGDLDMSSWGKEDVRQRRKRRQQWRQKLQRSAPLGGGRKGEGAVRHTPARPVPSGRGELVDTTGGDSPPHPKRPGFLQ